MPEAESSIPLSHVNQQVRKFLGPRREVPLYTSQYRLQGKLPRPRSGPQAICPQTMAASNPPVERKLLDPSELGTKE